MFLCYIMFLCHVGSMLGFHVKLCYAMILFSVMTPCYVASTLILCDGTCLCCVMSLCYVVSMSCFYVVLCYVMNLQLLCFYGMLILCFKKNILWYVSMLCYVMLLYYVKFICNVASMLRLCYDMCLCCYVSM